MADLGEREMEDLICTVEEGFQHCSLEREGYEFFDLDKIPFTSSEWSRLTQLMDEKQALFTRVYVGDTTEASSLSVLRVKNPDNANILHQELMNLVGSKKMIDFYRKICKNENLVIDRCQAHIYKEGDFISYHVDRESYSGYLYSLLFYISDDYAGGEMVMYIDGKACKFNIPKGTLLLADSSIPHEVLPVKSGVRKTVAVFLMEKTGKNGH